MTPAVTGALLGPTAAGGLLITVWAAPPRRRPRLEQRLAPYLRDSPAQVDGVGWPGHGAAAYVRFRLAVDVVTGGRRATVKLDDNGRPFEVTGWLDMYGAAFPFKHPNGRHFHGGYWVQQFRDTAHNPGYVRVIDPRTFKMPPDPPGSLGQGICS